MSKTTRTCAPTVLDLADIQGGILRNYGTGFAKGRSFFLHVSDGVKGRAFVEALRPLVTTATRWEDAEKHKPPAPSRHPTPHDVAQAEGLQTYPGPALQQRPKATLNIAFSHAGLNVLGVPAVTLQSMPVEFAEGMEARAPLLGDEPFMEGRDTVWRNSRGDRRVHILISMFAQMNADGTPCAELGELTGKLEALCNQSDGGVTMLDGVGPDNARWQDMSAVMTEFDGHEVPTNKEHFGFSDGYGDPVFSGQYPPEIEAIKIRGGGKLLPDLSWAPLATGEFLLGYADESQDTPVAARPHDFSRNGTFLAYRKLHENVADFDAYIARQADRYAQAMGVPADEASDTIRAKMIGRWPDGVPLMTAPTYREWQAFNAELRQARADGDRKKLAQLTLEFTNFHYSQDVSGISCPVTSHMRRANPRDQLGPTYDKAGNSTVGSSIVDRRRILRRGMPYGPYAPGAERDVGEQGIVFIAMCASLFRQFEFLQGQWMQYGLDFNAGSDTCPVIGNHLEPDKRKQVIAADPALGRPPFILDELPQLVIPKGGDYFFMPSMTALRMIGQGVIDPT
uniref:Dyp-type peroxidase n=1 Tax=Parerythrobacter lutipelagi TaxID=1964208 RepID=UPI0010F9B2AC|nr:hypothetical protein [Parerythrobacter lutipelagi]